MNKPMIFFDCWDTLIRFKVKDERWTTLPLFDHCTNKEKVDWQQVYAFAKEFLDRYYGCHSLYEIDSIAFLKLVSTLYSIEIDCSLEQADSEILSYLDPTPVEGIEDFLTFLESKGIRYACLSNTIYTREDTEKTILSQIKGHHFEFVFASSEVGVKKPNPYFFKAGLKTAGVEAKDAIYIGDAYLQDVYGSFITGFKKSYWLNYKKQSALNPAGYPGREGRKFREVTSYKQIQNDLIEEGIVL